MDPMLHSFGGSALDRHVFDFDTDDGVGDGGLIPAADPGLDPAVDPVVDSPWAPSQDEWAQVTNAVTYLAQLEQQRAQVYAAPQPAGQPVRLDPFADDFQDQLDRYVDTKTATFRQAHEQQRVQEADERIMDILADLKSSGGEFDVEMARMRVNQLAFELLPKYGDLWRATEAAATQAAEQQRQYEAKLMEQAVLRHTNQIKTLAGAPGDAGATYTVGAQTRTVPDYRQGGSVTDRFFQNA